MPIDFTGIEGPKRREQSQIDFSGIEGIDFSGVDEKAGSFSSLAPIIMGEAGAYAKQKAVESAKPLRVIPAAIKNAALYEIPKGIGGALQLSAETGALGNVFPLPGALRRKMLQEAERLGKEAGEIHGAIGRAEVPQGMTESERQVYGATSSIAQNLPLMATGPAALPLMGTLSAGQERAELQAADVPQERAIPASVGTGVVEAITEKLPLGALMKRGVPFVKRLVASYLTDIPGELVATTTQLALDEWAKAPEKSLAEFKAKILPSLVDTVIQTSIAGPVQTAAVHPFVKNVPPPEREAATMPAEQTGKPPALPIERRGAAPVPSGGLAYGGPERRAVKPLVPSEKALELSTKELGVESETIGPGELRVGDTFSRGGKQLTVTRKGELGTAYYADEMGKESSLREGKTLTIEKGSFRSIPERVTFEPEKVVPKEPWEMTQREYVGREDAARAATRTEKTATGYKHTDTRTTENIYDEHINAVKQALSEGKSVPPEVLADYPELKGTRPTSKVAALNAQWAAKEREAKVFQETQDKFASEAASTETISGREIRRKKETILEPVGAAEERGGIKLANKEDLKTQRVKSQDATILGRLFGTLNVADKHPVIKPIINRIIKGELDWNHRRNQMEERITQIWDKYEKPSVIQKLFGKRGTALEDIQAWREGKKAVPEKYKPMMEEITQVFKEYRDRVIEGRTNELLAGLNKKQRDIYDRVMAGENINTIEKVSNTARAKVQAAVKDVTEMQKWGLSPEEYFPHAFSGGYKFLDSSGNIVASGETARQASARLVEYAELHPDMKEETYIGTSTLAELLETRKELKGEALQDRILEYMDDHPEATGKEARQAVLTNDPSLANKSALDYLGTVLPRKQYGALIGKANKAANEAAKQAVEEAGLEEAGIKVKLDMRGVASPTPRKKFVGFMQKRTSNIKGDIQDPFKVTMSYIGAMERKFAADEMRKEVVPMIENLPASKQNLKDIATKAMDWTGHYSWENRLVDEGRRKLAETKVAKKLGVSELLRGKPYLATRTMSRVMGGEAMAKLGFAPVKALINRVGGVSHIWIKENPANWVQGRAWLKTEEGKRIFKEYGHLTGMDQPFTASGRESYAKATGNLLSPLGLYNRAEFKNRPEAFAAAFVKAKKDGASEQQAIDTAIESARLTQGLYTMSSLPVAVRGPVLKSAYQFKQYMMNEARFMKSLTPAQWAAYIPYIMAMSGTRGTWLTIKSILPLTIIGALFLDKGEEEAEKMNVKQPYLHRGLPGIAFGVDVSAPATWQLPQRMKDLLGPTISDGASTVQMMVKGMKNSGWTADEIHDYFQQIAPTGYNIYKAFQILSEGKTERGEKTMRRNVNPWEAAINLAGARTVEESQEQDTARYLKKKGQDFNERKRVMTDKFFEAREDGKAGEVLRQMIKEGMVPQKVTDSGLEYDFTGLKRSATDKQLTRLQRIIKTLPQPVKREYYKQQSEAKNERARTALPFFKRREKPGAVLER